jgi:tetraacyldisaccharide 4'-kinase
MSLPWHDEGDESYWQQVARAPLVPMAWGFEAGVRAHRSLYRTGLRSQRSLPCQVVSIGGLVAGGSGKTPLAAWLARRLRARGVAVALASRGYGRATSEPVTLVSDGRVIRAAVARTGDEPLVLAAEAPGVPVLVGRDRGIAGLRAAGAEGAELLILDDGMQHHRLQRDVEIACVDAGMGFGNGWCLPRGPLREPLAGLSRCDAVVVVDGDLKERDRARLRGVVPGVRQFRANRRIRGFRRLGERRLVSPESFAGESFGVLCGIGSPAALRRSLADRGIEIASERLFPDHHRYRPCDLVGLEDAASRWIVTSKDAVKLRPAWFGPAEAWVVDMELDVVDGDSFVEWLTRALAAAR